MKTLLAVLAVAGTVWATPITLGTLEHVTNSTSVVAPTGSVCPVGTCNLSSGGIADLNGVAIGDNNLSFVLAVASDVTFYVQDYASVGDVYEIFNGSTPIGTSTQVSLGGTTPTSCPGNPDPNAGAAQAAGNSCLAVTVLDMAAGTYNIGIWDIILSYVGSAGPYGGGTVGASYSPADYTFEVTATPTVGGVPEPGSFALMGIGLLGIAFAFRKRAFGSK
jgi:hypothetical protein